MKEEDFTRFRILDRLRRDYPERLKPMELLTDRISKLTAWILDAQAFDRLVPELLRSFEMARYEKFPYVTRRPLTDWCQSFCAALKWHGMKSFPMWR